MRKIKNALLIQFLNVFPVYPEIKTKHLFCQKKNIKRKYALEMTKKRLEIGVNSFVFDFKGEHGQKMKSLF